MKSLIILGNDKIGGAAFERLSTSKSLSIMIDLSSNLNRIFELIRKKKIGIRLFIKMILAELMRSGSKPPKSLPSISSNAQLLERIKKEHFQKIILFRAGLIIRKSVIETGIQIFNVHAAKVPEYGGIGSINRALKDEAFDQFACFHRVTNKIDDGEVVDKESYTLSPDEPYYVNEDIAYEAATCLLLRNVELKSS